MEDFLQTKTQTHHLTSRPRRLRLSPGLRRMVRETELHPTDFIYPLFVRHGKNVRTEIRSMPGIYQFSVDHLSAEAESIVKLDIPAVILFGIPAEKDFYGSENFASNGIIQQSIRAIKDAVPELVVISDVCMCEYTDHGHCGVINSPMDIHYHPNLPEGYVLNGETLERT
jgi:porphobilinogen synthase